MKNKPGMDAVTFGGKDSLPAEKTALGDSREGCVGAVLCPRGRARGDAQENGAAKFILAFVSSLGTLTPRPRFAVVLVHGQAQQDKAKGRSQLSHKRQRRKHAFQLL